MGKPMGNGHPVAAAIMRPDLLAQFGEKSRYFNTFGGNTVSCAAAAATLDVIEQEGLLANADRVGAYFREGLQALMARHEVIGDVRGAGLFLGLRSDEHTSELQSLMRISYAVFCLKKKKISLHTSFNKHFSLLILYQH